MTPVYSPLSPAFLPYKPWNHPKLAPNHSRGQLPQRQVRLLWCIATRTFSLTERLVSGLQFPITPNLKKNKCTKFFMGWRLTWRNYRRVNMWARSLTAHTKFLLRPTLLSYDLRFVWRRALTSPALWNLLFPQYGAFYVPSIIYFQILNNSKKIFRDFNIYLFTSIIFYTRI